MHLCMCECEYVAGTKGIVMSESVNGRTRVFLF